MTNDNVYLGDEARASLMRGVDKVADAVKGTLGAGGYNALLEDFRPPYSVATNDGISVAKSIVLSDAVENMGANLMREIGSSTDKDGGDGTTTSITLAQAILKEGQKLTDSPMAIKRSLEECLPAILQGIDEQTRPITVMEVGKVASISAEDESIGALIQEIYQKIGKDGILYPDISKTPNDHYEVGNGVKIDEAGLLSPLMADIDERGTYTKTVVIKDPKILLTKQKLASALQLEPIVNALYRENIRDLVIICDDIDPAVVPELIKTRNGTAAFRVIVIKLPVLWRDEWFEDIAKMTGATIVDPALGLALKDVAVNYLGTCGNLVTGRYDTYFDGIKDMGDYIATLKAGTDEDKIRAARLNTSTARLFVGASSDTALTYKRLKVEDARNAAWQALHHGVVAGGGIALANIAQSMPNTIGGNILRKTLLAPFYQILENAGLSDGRRDVGGTIGVNVKTGEEVDMFEAGILDPAKVVKNAVTNAISVAATVLTTKVIICLPKVDNDVAGKQGMVTI